jgi:hypothetical protein
VNIEEFTDVNGLIKSRRAFKDSGNGILETGTGVVLEMFNPLDFEERVRACYIQTGCLKRTPNVNPDFGQEQWDDYLGVAAAFARAKRRGYALGEVPQEIIEFGDNNLWFFDSDGKLEMKDFLGRFPHVFILMHEIAYPTQSPVIYSMLNTVRMTMNADPIKDPGEFRLEWLFHQACADVGMAEGRLPHYQRNISKALEIYCDADHPFVLETRRRWG